MRRNRFKLTFRRPFSVKGIDRPLSPGNYELVPDHELKGELYFPEYRHVVSLLFVPTEAHKRSFIVKASVDPADILASHVRDQACD
ncbi:MAG: hypothetical protein WAK90_16305 [Pseudolabrys sp.]|jgi:hypothetical protein